MRKKNEDSEIKDEIKDEVKQEVEEIDKEKLEQIENELKNNKECLEKTSKIKKAILSIVTGIIFILYFVCILFGKTKVAEYKVELALRILSIAYLVISIILFEISMKKDKESIFLSGIELAVMGGITLYILKLFINYNEFINKYIGIAIGVVAGYYLIKALVIVIKKIKKEETAEEDEE